MKIGQFDLAKEGVFIIAELSANHGGDIEVAKATIKRAKEVGANAIKLQTYRADTLTLNAPQEDFQIKGETLWDGQSLYALYDQAAMPWEWHEPLFAYARYLGIDIFSSPFDKSAVDLLEPLSPSAYKIASFEITDHSLIRYAASKGRPMLISTGIATLEEISEAVAICREEGNEQIVLLKCTSAYPAPLEDANLATIPNLVETFGVYSGFSDHTLGDTGAVIATTLGAKVIEKHFILDKSLGGPDAAFSMEPEAFERMVKAIRETEVMVGSVDYQMTSKKRQSRQFARSLYVAKPIKKGERFSEENIKSVRPGYGLHPRYLERILGMEAPKDYVFGERLSLPPF